MSTVLLGVPDAAVESETTWEVNKIGGSPDLMVSMATPVCERCRTLMVHVMQIYCPLELSPFHRVLHIFACVSKSCWNKPHGWKVFRSQLRDKSSASCDSGFSSKEKAAKETGDWCDEADDWGCDDDEYQDLVAMVTDVPSDSQVLSDSFSDHLGNSELSRQTESSCSESVEDGSDENSVVSQLDGLDVSEDTFDVQEEDGCFKPDKVALENALCYLATSDSQSDEAYDKENLLSCKACPEDFKCFYLDVFDEPASELTDAHHVAKLLKEYERKERVDVGSLVDLDRPGGKSGSGEKYEKTELKHGDKYFHKFMKRLKICPEQVVRYQYGGNPLLISQPRGDISPLPCSTCRAPRLFELQIVPPLIPYLRKSPERDPAVEFGTVIIFTCSQSCWEEESPLPREEFVLVQSDPDQHLFKM